MVLSKLQNFMEGQKIFYVKNLNSYYSQNTIFYLIRIVFLYGCQHRTSEQKLSLLKQFVRNSI